MAMHGESSEVRWAKNDLIGCRTAYTRKQCYILWLAEWIDTE
jgi:hypothetical protein